MRIQAEILGTSKFDYTKNGVTTHAGTVYFAYPDARTDGLKTGNMFLTDQTPDYGVLVDPKNIGKKMDISVVFANNKTYYSFVDFVK